VRRRSRAWCLLELLGSAYSPARSQAHGCRIQEFPRPFHDPRLVIVALPDNSGLFLRGTRALTVTWDEFARVVVAGEASCGDLS